MLSGPQCDCDAWQSSNTYNPATSLSSPFGKDLGWHRDPHHFYRKLSPVLSQSELWQCSGGDGDATHCQHMCWTAQPTYHARDSSAESDSSPLYPLVSENTFKSLTDPLRCLSSKRQGSLKACRWRQRRFPAKLSPEIWEVSCFNHLAYLFVFLMRVRILY